MRQVAREAGVLTTITFSYPQRWHAGSPPPPSCVDLTVDGGVAVCQTGNAALALRELLAWAAAGDLGDLEDLAVSKPTLEDAYLRLVTGGAH